MPAYERTFRGELTTSLDDSEERRLRESLEASGARLLEVKPWPGDPRLHFKIEVEADSEEGADEAAKRAIGDYAPGWGWKIIAGAGPASWHQAEGQIEESSV